MWEKMEGILSRLLQDCDFDLELAERGIVFIDEGIRLHVKVIIHLLLEMSLEKGSKPC